MSDSFNHCAKFVHTHKMWFSQSFLTERTVQVAAACYLDINSFKSRDTIHYLSYIPLRL